MTLQGGNLAIRDHLKNGKDILLFEKVSRDGTLRFEGSFYCDSYHWTPAPGTDGSMREAIVFHLIPEESMTSEMEYAVPGMEENDDGTNGHENTSSQQSSLSVLRAAALEAAGTPSSQSPGDVKRTAHTRSAAVRRYALARAEGYCECCSEKAPFITEKGRPFLEVHHTHRLGDGGPDAPDKVAAICPNCHRQIHYGRNGDDLNTQLKQLVADREYALIASIVG